MSNKPFFSVIIATYNAEIFIGRALESVIQQGVFNKNVELIVIDGKSTDSTVDIIKKYNKYISYYVSEEDSGIYDAYNKGLQKANGEYVYFLGADDWLYARNVLGLIMNIIKQNFPDVLSCPVCVVDEKLQLYKTSGGRVDLENLKKCIIMPPHQGMFMKTSTLKNNNYKFDTTYKLMADAKLFYDMIAVGDYKYYDVVVANFNNTGASSNNYFEMNDECHRLFCEKISRNNKYYFVEFLRYHTRHIRYMLRILKDALFKLVGLKIKQKISSGWNPIMDGKYSPRSRL